MNIIKKKLIDAVMSQEENLLVIGHCSPIFTPFIAKKLTAMAKYSFVTHWTFDASIESVWKEIRNMDAWPQWWKYVKSVELIKNENADDIGSVRRITWTTALPYELTFDSELVSVDFQKRMEGRAFGELTGVGIWTFNEVNGKTHVRYVWIVETTKQWMNLFAPIARPLFKWNHDKVMEAGYIGLAARLSQF